MQAKAEAGKSPLDFFDWEFANGAKMAESLDYVLVPRNVADLAGAVWRDVNGADQKPF
jgi:phosphate transport system substrate-binding protein